ncbi:oligosaccharide flippase family protein [Rufibacter latericius]|uniref:Polysaccharide biosynthesis protein n=1 Tax=Rufibacter latericius TaxID=2487040 RepID=A0A3M9MA59_9BACT|nr:oligosaccharide flippase family protein [Rufibacter latericius]RNI22449.1 hypothetical protein EFB08_20300 [Rufibacter latericius]
MIFDLKRKLSSLLFTNSLLGRFNKGAFWILVSTVGLQGSNLLVTIFLARFFGQTGYGEISLTVSTFALVGEIAGLGFGLTTTKYIAEYRQKEFNKVNHILGLTLGFSLLLGLVFSLILLFWPQIITVPFIKAPELNTLFRIGAFQIFFNAVSGVILGVLSGLEAFPSIGISNLIRGGLYVFSAVIGSFFFGAPGAVMATTVSAGVGVLVAFLFLRKRLQVLGLAIKFKGALQEASILSSFALPALLSNLSVIAAVWVTNILLVNQASGFSELGQLNVANQWKNLLMLMPNIIAQVLLPLLSSELALNENSSSNKMLGMFQSITALVIFPVGTLFMFFAEGVLFIYGQEFKNSQEVLIGSVWSVMVASAGSVLGAYVQSTGKMWIGFTTNITYGVLLVLLTYLFAGAYGANAVAFGSGLAYVFINGLSLFLLRNHVSRQLVKQILLALVLSVLLVIFCLSVDPAYRFFFGLVALVLVELFLFKAVISTEVRQGVFRLFSKFVLKNG